MYKPLTALGLLLSAAACSTTPTQPVDPPSLRSILQTVKVDSQWPSRDALMADPTSTPVDTDIQLIRTEQALRQCNGNIINGNAVLEEETNEQRTAVPRP